MRSIRTAVAALSLAALALAGCGSNQPSAPAAPATTPTTVTPATTQPPPPSGGGVVARPGPAEAVSTAVAFIRREVGMRDLVAGPFRWTGRQTGRVEVRPRFSGDGRSVTGPVTTVDLQRLSRVWYVLGTSTSTIRVSAPLPGTRVASPLTKVLAQDTSAEGGWRLTWRYPAGALMGHLFVHALGPAGRAEWSINVYHS